MFVFVAINIDNEKKPRNNAHIISDTHMEHQTTRRMLTAKFLYPLKNYNFHVNYILAIVRLKTKHKKLKIKWIAQYT